tara:strand:+ start:1417 stop:1875 length:459 start_codon:yes stop_codon:yes gene_type:complete
MPDCIDFSLNFDVKVLPIFSTYADKIRDGTKLMELRTYNPGIYPGTWTLLYETRPAQVIRTAFYSSGFICMTPIKLWHKYSKIMGITWEAYESYFDGKSCAYGVNIAHVINFEPISYQQLKQDINFIAPLGCKRWKYGKFYTRIFDKIISIN